MTHSDIDSLEATCRVCLETKPREDVDRILWCEPCIEKARDHATSQSWFVGLAVGVALALWIWLYIQPSDLVIGGWVGTVVGAFYVSARVAREVLYGVARVRGGSTSPVDTPAVAPGPAPEESRQDEASE